MNYKDFNNKQQKADKVAKEVGEMLNQVRIVDIRIVCTDDAKKFGELCTKAIADGYKQNYDHMVIQHEDKFKYVQGFKKTEPIGDEIISTYSDDISEVRFINTQDADEFNNFCANALKDNFFPSAPYNIRAFEDKVWFEVRMIKTRKIKSGLIAKVGKLVH